MQKSDFFQHLNTAYQAELDDLRFDSEGKEVLQQRLQSKRQELGFLLKMVRLCPEMVAVVLHGAFEFTGKKVDLIMQDVLQFDAEDLQIWSVFSTEISIAKWAQCMVDAILQHPDGEWFLTVAASLEYLQTYAQSSHENDDNGLNEDPDFFDDAVAQADAEELQHAKNKEAQGQAWMEAQGFDAISPKI